MPRGQWISAKAAAQHGLGLRAALVAVLALVLIALLFTPRLGSPLRRLVNFHAHRGYLDTPDPLWDAPVAGAAWRRAGEIVPENASYYVYAPSSSLQLRLHDLPAAGLLFLTRALPVKHPRDASYVVSYRAPRLLPQGLVARRVHRVGERIFVVEVQP